MWKGGCLVDVKEGREKKIWLFRVPGLNVTGWKAKYVFPFRAGPVTVLLPGQGAPAHLWIQERVSFEEAHLSL